jgi:hypothetical protein
MADPMILAAAAVLIIGAIAGATVKVVTAVGAMKRELLMVTNSTNVKADEIHGLVDGSATKAAEKLAALELKLIAVQEQLANVQEKRVVDAQAQALHAQRSAKENL